jgi:hypothetical protein
MKALADASCSATTMRRRRDEWTRLGVSDRLKLACLDAYDKAIGLDLAHLAVDGCTTKAPYGGECAGRSPVDRAQGGLKRSRLTDDAVVPIATVSASANTVDHALLAQTLDALKDFQPLPEQLKSAPDQQGWDWSSVHLSPIEEHLPGEEVQPVLSPCPGRHEQRPSGRSGRWGAADRHRHRGRSGCGAGGGAVSVVQAAGGP